MRVALTFLCLFICASAFADNQIYLFGTTEIEFWNFGSSKITVSSHCISNAKLNHCDAIKGLKILSFKRLERAKFGGPNPGGLLCEQQLNGLVMVGIDKVSLNENSFCKLHDGSIIDDGTLISYGIQNDRAEERETDSFKSKNRDKKPKEK